MWLIKGHFPFFFFFIYMWMEVTSAVKGKENNEEKERTGRPWGRLALPWQRLDVSPSPIASQLSCPWADWPWSLSVLICKTEMMIQSLLCYNALLRFKWCNHNCGIIVVGASWPTILKSPLINCTEVLEGIQEIHKTKVYYCHKSRIIS